MADVAPVGDNMASMEKFARMELLSSRYVLLLGVTFIDVGRIFSTVISHAWYPDREY